MSTSVAISGSAAAQDPADLSKPDLRIESPFAAPLWRAGVDASETYVVTGSPYKAVTVWPLPDVSVRSTLRVPILDEQRKRAHGVAISPDGKTVATSVPPKAAKSGLPIAGTAKIYLLNREDGSVLRTIGKIPTRPQVLRFSPDGKYVAAVLSDGCGVRVWEASSGELFGGDDDNYSAPGKPALHCAKGGGGAALNVDSLPDSIGLEFAREDGEIWFVTSGASGVRTYKKTAGGIAVIRFASPKDIGLEVPGDVDFSPDGSELVVGERRDRRLGTPVYLRAAVLKSADLSQSRKPFEVTAKQLVSAKVLDVAQNPPAQSAALEQVAWVNFEDDEEEFVYLGGVLPCRFVKQRLIEQKYKSQVEQCIARFPLEEDEDITFIPVGTDSVMDLIGLPKRGGLLYAAQRQVGIVDYDGEPLDLPSNRQLKEASPAADFRSGKLDFRVSEDGKSIQFMDYRSRDGKFLWLSFDVGDLALSEDTKRADGALKAPALDTNLIKNWYDTPTPPKVFGKDIAALKATHGDYYRSAAVHSEKKRVLLGSSDYIRVIDLVGRKPSIACQLRIEFEAFRVNLVSDGTLAVVGHSDGTLRWYRIIKEGKGCKLHQVLSVHIAKNTSGEWSWSAWLPSGHFANDARAENLFGWQSTNADGEVIFEPRADRLDLYSRDKVSKVLDPGAPLPKGLDLTPGFHDVLSAPVASKSQVVVITPGEFTQIDDEAIKYKVFFKGAGPWPKKLTVETGRGVGLSLIHDGKTLGPGEPLSIAKKGKIEFEAVLPASARYSKGISHVCFYLDGVRHVCRGIDWAGDIVPLPPRRLWAVLVGVSEYDHPSLNLNAAHNDAIDFAKLFVRDFELRGSGAGGGPERDFASVNIDLIVSPPSASQSAKADIADLAKHPYVTTHPATRAGVLAALDELVKRDQNEEMANDLIVFYFSGHGYVHPYNERSGKSLFLTSETNPVFSRDTIAGTSITSADLLERLSKISGEKLFILDACRVPYSRSVVPFDPTLVKLEFIENLFSAHYFFSGQAGQSSIDQRTFVVDPSRPANERGNGIFTYSFLKSLTDKAADSRLGKLEYRNRIEVTEAKLYVDRLFDLKDTNSVINRLNATAKKPIKVLQQPQYIPARGAGALVPFKDVSVLRTLDP
ncbi:MAG: caspase family protein [Alphaproteobacteria bacterium]|nr:caspase family protein [Alphaproteobacteria bacterium]